jgi:hypothetical protein
MTDALKATVLGVQLYPRSKMEEVSKVTSSYTSG